MTGSATDTASAAGSQLAQLVGRRVDHVVGMSRGDEGWTVSIEVVESERIPESSDLMALYDVRMDGEGRLVEFTRVRRYLRGRPDE